MTCGYCMDRAQQLIIIFGPPAVGKMTVGSRLADSLGYKLFHNHMSIELVRKFFDFSEIPFWPLVSKIRYAIFNAVAESYLPGFIFTYVWDLSSESDENYIQGIIDIYEEKEWEVKFVELEASLATRLKRNRGRDRISEKPSKQDIEKSESLLMEYENAQLNSDGTFDFSTSYLKIDSTDLDPSQTAEMIINHFGFDLDN